MRSLTLPLQRILILALMKQLVLPFIKQEKQAIIFIGIQASGKTTFYNQMLSDGTYTHISLDDLRTRNKERQEMMIKIEKEMKKAAANLDFEKAVELRDILFELRSEGK